MVLNLKRILSWGGTALAVAGVAIVMLRLYDEGAAVYFGRFSPSYWLVFSGLALSYGLSNSLLALAWRHLLAKLGTVMSRPCTMRIYGLSQVAKYLPGNIFHLAGRQALGMAAGAPGWLLAKSTVWELGLMATTGALFGCLALPLLFSAVSVPVSILLWLLTLGLVAWLVGHFGGTAIVWAFGLQTVFLMLSGGIFLSLVVLVTASPGLLISLGPSVAAAYVVAWLVGLVTPGAPAGAGVREIVLLMLLSAVLTKVDVVTVLILGRFVTVLGDLAFFLAATLIRHEKAR
jgi:hypothetical protein